MLQAIVRNTDEIEEGAGVKVQVLRVSPGKLRRSWFAAQSLRVLTGTPLTPRAGRTLEM